MSDHLAIAVVTATVRQLLFDAVNVDMSGAEVTIVTPDDPSLKNDKPRLNLFLYRVTPNGAWRNADMPARGEGGLPIAQPQVALDLHYLLTAYGKSTAKNPEAHSLLGSAVKALREQPVLRREAIHKAVAGLDQYFKSADLADQVEPVRLTMQPLSLEEISNLWSVLSRNPYHLSVAYQASVVVI